MRYENAKTSEIEENIANAIQEAISSKKSVLLLGGTGTGKTYTMHALGNLKRVKVDNFITLLVEFRDAMQRGHYFDNMKTLIGQDYLFIDDIGAEKTSEFVIEFLYLVVNGRYENMKRSIFSTNLTLEQIGERYGERILSRLAEMCVIVDLGNVDKRIEKLSTTKTGQTKKRGV